jgi:hypothetical protein
MRALLLCWCCCALTASALFGMSTSAASRYAAAARKGLSLAEGGAACAAQLAPLREAHAAALEAEAGGTAPAALAPPLARTLTALGKCLPPPNSTEVLARALNLTALDAAGQDGPGSVDVLEALGLRQDMDSMAGLNASQAYLERAARALQRQLKAAKRAAKRASGGKRKGGAAGAAPPASSANASTSATRPIEERLAGVHRLLLTTYQLQGALDKAIGVGRKALEFYVSVDGGNGPDPTEAANALAVALASAGALGEAEEVARAAHEAHSAHARPSPQLLLNLQATGCATLVRAQRTEEAVYLCSQALEPAVELEGASSVMVGKLHAYLAHAHLTEKSARGALEEGLKALPILRQLTGDNGRATQNLAFTLRGALEMVGDRTEWESLEQLAGAAGKALAALPKPRPQAAA